MTGASPRGVTRSLDASMQGRSRVMGSAQPHSPQDTPTTVQAICVRTRRSVPGASGVLPASPSTRLSASGSSSEFTPPSGYRRRARRAPPWGTTGLERARCLPGFLPLQHIRIGTFTHIARVCLTRLRSVFRVSYPPDGLPRPDPSGLVSSRKRSWGCDPSEPCSFRGAVAPLGARCPPVVTIAGPPRCLTRTPSHAEPWFTRAGPPGGAARAGMRRLQGIAPLGSP
jgi:hypothetical protein